MREILGRSIGAVENFVNSVGFAVSDRLFCPWLHRRSKYRGKKLYFLSKNEYFARYQEIESRIQKSIIEAQNESQMKFQKDYPFVGVIVFGSYARGKVHTLSDLDVLCLSRVKVGYDEENKFNKRLDLIMPDGISDVELWGSELVVDTDNLRKSLKEPLYGRFRVISPYEDVVKTVESARPNYTGLLSMFQ